MVRWTIYDPVVGTTTAFPYNPTDATMPSEEKQFSSQHTTAVQGKFVPFEGSLAPQDITLSGTGYTEEDLQFWTDWLALKYQVRLTDDLGQQWWVYLQKFSSKRKRNINWDYLHTYEATLVVMDI